MAPARIPLVPPPEPAAVEAALAAVAGVSSATVVPDPDGGPGTLRLTLSPDGDVVDVARAVHRVLRLQFGAGLDPRHMEVVDVSLPEQASPPGPRLRIVAEPEHDVDLGAEMIALLADLDEPGGPSPRFRTEVLASAARHPAGAIRPAVPERGDGRFDRELAIARLALSADGLGVSATVTLTRRGRELVGSVHGPASPTAVHRIVAGATLAALEEIIGAERRVDVEAVAMAAVGDSTVAVVQVVWATVEGSERLTGAAEVRGNPLQAVIRATLDSVNRRLAPLLEIR
ncbi:MAG TPA: hypothetical protein VLV82_08315 [Candidatus Angelobacter sp.]|nr:hypothetical protein [Candidatus Angelobacter sp.]